MAGASTKDIQEPAGRKTITMAATFSHLSPAYNRSVVDLITGTGGRATEETTEKASTEQETNMHHYMHQMFKNKKMPLD